MDFALHREPGHKPDFAVTKNICNNLVNQLFFSAANIDALQNAIRYRVWEQTSHNAVIGKQSVDELVLVMRSIYYQFGKNLPTRITEQLEDLNDLVVRDVVPRIVAGVSQHIVYLKDIRSPLDPMPRSVCVNSSGTRTLRSVTSTF